MKNGRALNIAILVSLLFGAFVGQLLFDSGWKSTMPLAEHRYGTLLISFEFFGMRVFMGLLKMLIMPLIAASVLVSVTSVGDLRDLGRLGRWTVVYYFSTMIIAVLIGLALVTLLSPGEGLVGALQDLPQEMIDEGVISKSAQESAEGGLIGVFSSLIRLLVPENIFAALAEGKTLSVIVFFIFFGVVVTSLGEHGAPIVALARAVQEVSMKMVEIVLWLAPLGVFCLLAWSVARIGLGVFAGSIGHYMVTVLIGLAIHALFVLPLVLWLFTKKNPFRFAHQMRAAITMAIGTDSSAATLPVTIEAATTEGGVSERAAGLVLPLGATVNMDGTALYEAVAVVFIAQVAGIALGPTQLILVALTATLAAVGAASIPSAGLVTMIIVIDAVNQSLLSADPNAVLIPVAGISLIIGVDRLLDMMRTAVNVWGDAVGAKLISEWDTEFSS